MAVTKIKPIKSTLSKALDYIENPDKTDGKMLVSSFGCSYETADIEFEYTLSQALQKGNNLAFHLIQSFEPGEVDYQKAHEIGKQLADAVTKGQHEYVLTTHIDKGHVHNHIIFCAVNFVDHHKYNREKYRAGQEQAIILHEAAVRSLKAAGIAKLPNLAALQSEYEALQAQKEALYADYGKLKKKVREYDIIKQNIDSILQADRQPEREKETERG